MANNLQHLGPTRLAWKQLNLSRSSLHSLQWFTPMYTQLLGCPEHRATVAPEGGNKLSRYQGISMILLVLVLGLSAEHGFGVACLL